VPWDKPPFAKLINYTTQGTEWKGKNPPDLRFLQMKEKNLKNRKNEYGRKTGNLLRI